MVKPREDKLLLLDTSENGLGPPLYEANGHEALPLMERIPSKKVRPG